MNTPRTGRSTVAPDPLAHHEPLTIEDCIAELDRELTMRHRVYPEQIKRGKLKAEVAQKRIRILNALLKTLRAKAAEGPLFR